MQINAERFVMGSLEDLWATFSHVDRRNDDWMFKVPYEFVVSQEFDDCPPEFFGLILRPQGVPTQF
jgi:hypothetical protein